MALRHRLPLPREAGRHPEWVKRGTNDWQPVAWTSEQIAFWRSVDDAARKKAADALRKYMRDGFDLACASIIGPGRFKSK